MEIGVDRGGQEPEEQRIGEAPSGAILDGFGIDDATRCLGRRRIDSMFLAKLPGRRFYEIIVLYLACGKAALEETRDLRAVNQRPAARDGNGKGSARLGRSRVSPHRLDRAMDGLLGPSQCRQRADQLHERMGNT